MKKPIFIKSVFSLLFVMCLSYVIFQRSEKKKTDFIKITGRIMMFSKSLQSNFTNDTNKNRYLQIENSPKTFSLYIGKEKGDFKPQFENVDALKVGDTISIYYDDNYQTLNNSLNSLTYFIDRNQESIFIKGGWEKYFSYFLFGLSIFLLLVLFILKKKGKII